MWARIERFVKDSAKRSKTLPAFIEALKPRLACETISPRWMRIGSNGEVPLLAVHDAETGALREYVQIDDPDRREFPTKLVERSDARQTIQRLFSETAWVVMLVRDRIEREKPAEKRLTAAVDAEIEGEAA
ncbi:hypothetical protein [Aureimonas sp. Leaf324]|uniref:hypothetical protein n=1 Tax=Aureimonas sp. Leaf324 TaxID=1736336 RepID=UPI0006FCB7B6|nr:hypothetical protein [Aureimonas sp. Leaf324]KQQ90968.1 hypothetical protein ASF65_00035 [Aureimonas sp. Leaf324]